MAESLSLLKAIRRILNETRQDRVCREYLADSEKPLVPYLGSKKATYGFLAVAPTGLEEDRFPSQAEEYIDYAGRYFSNDKTDKGPFVHHLPLTRNLSKDYATFGEVSSVSFVVPIPCRRTSEISLPMLEACWPRALTMVNALAPKILFCSGSSLWKLIAGLEENTQPLVKDLPEHLRRPLAEIYQQTQGAQLVVKASFVDLESNWSPLLVPLPHLGRSALSKPHRELAMSALDEVRRRLYSRPSKGRIRVRRPG